MAGRPDRLLGVVVHEPPLGQLLPTGSPERREIERIGRLGLPAHVLSERLGIPCQEFPGGHLPFMQHPEKFTETLTKILEGFAA